MREPSGETAAELAALLGIEPHYKDIWGNLHTTSRETKQALIRAMGIRDPAGALEELKHRPWNRLIEPVLVVSEDERPETIPVHFPLPEGMEDALVIETTLLHEDGGTETARLPGGRPSAEHRVDGVRHVRVDLPLSVGKDQGYHTLTVTLTTPARTFTGTMRLIVAPARCFVPDVHTWGITVNLYALRSARNWGVGDLGDLRRLIRWTGEDLGGSFVGINPLHATANDPSLGISPYSPLSRLFRNILYLDMEDILPPSKSALSMARSPEVLEERAALASAPLIDYAKTAALKMRIFKAAFKDFLESHLTRGTREAGEFLAYVEREGEPLESFATHMALLGHFSGTGGTLRAWPDWPVEYQDPHGEAVQKFKTLRREEIRFHQFLQWQLERQLAEASREARGMAVGIYQDLAVGSSGRGADAWAYPRMFAHGVTAGAPPDNFNVNGQDWGFPPLIPERLRESGYEVFIQTIRENMRHASSLRIDHALGLFRLFWIPGGSPPSEGTYVRYPHEDLLKIIALESVRSRTAVIAEDLGTIGENVREALSRASMFSSRLLLFERDRKSGEFLAPGNYPALAVSAVTTHDLPTLGGYWTGRDITVKKELGIYDTDESAALDMEKRRRDKELLLKSLMRALPEGHVPEEEFLREMSPELVLAVHRFLGGTPSMMVAVILDDILGVPDQQNIPGTEHEYPNWRQRMPIPLEEVFRNETARALARMFMEKGRA
jgi:(1->4)-alpha-D-glucan 1-alpha-D-glucosylmutase